MFKLKTINQKILDKTMIVITFAGISALIVVLSAGVTLVIIEEFPFSFYIIFGVLLAWCLLYKAIEWYEGRT